jgi:hypothetical protein
MHVFRTLGRIAMMPGAGAAGDGSGLVPVTEGAHFRKEHSDMVLLALKLLVENSGRATPAGSKETMQKSLLSEVRVRVRVRVQFRVRVRVG